MPNAASCEDMPSCASAPTVTRARPLAQEPLGQPVLPPVEEAVHPAEHGRVPGRASPSRQALDVEVDAEDGGQGNEAERGDDRPARVPAEPGEEGGVDEQVAL